MRTPRPRSVVQRRRWNIAPNRDVCDSAVEDEIAASVSEARVSWIYLQSILQENPEDPIVPWQRIPGAAFPVANQHDADALALASEINEGFSRLQIVRRRG